VATPGAASKWTSGLVAEARLSAQRSEHHIGHHELIEVGRSYIENDKDFDVLVNNVFANIQSLRGI